MPSFKSTVFAVAAAFVATAHADYYVEPSSVPLATRSTNFCYPCSPGNTYPAVGDLASMLTGNLTEAWCADEKNTCPIICQQVEPRTTLVNDCDPVSSKRHQQQKHEGSKLTRPLFPPHRKPSPTAASAETRTSPT